MDQEKFGNLIKEIRKKNNLTQKDLALKYNVTYQAVSKWENGKNLPDISLIRQIANDFNMSIDDMMSGVIKEKKNNKKIMLISIISLLVIIVVLLFLLLSKNNNDLHSREIRTTCDDFNIYGIISYNETKSAIYIPKIEYCGNDKNVKFKEINCTLYEKYDDSNKVVSSYDYHGDDLITLDVFLKDVSFHVDNYLKKCQNYDNNSLYLEIKGNTENSNLFYTIPLLIEMDSCISQP